MLFKTKTREIEARVVFNEREKYDLNSPINPNLNEKVLMWLFVRFVSKTSTIAHG